MLLPDEDTRDLRLKLALKMALASRHWRACVSALNQATGNEDHVLITLYELATHPSGLMQVELAKQLGLAESSAARLVAEMLKDGLVTRCRMPGDRRAWLVRITPAGKEVLAKYEPRARVLRERLMVGLSDEDLNHTIRILTCLIERMKTEIETDRF